MLYIYIYIGEHELPRRPSCDGNGRLVVVVVVVVVALVLLLLLLLLLVLYY